MTEFHRFQKLSVEVVDVSEKICALRPVEDTLALLRRIFAERKQTGDLDLEAVEMAFRAALHQAGAAALGQLLRFPEPAADQGTIPCPCGSQAHDRELRARRILTALGEVELTRPWYLCPLCHHGQFPVDRQLDNENRDCSPRRTPHGCASGPARAF